MCYSDNKSRICFYYFASILKISNGTISSLSNGRTSLFHLTIRALQDFLEVIEENLNFARSRFANKKPMGHAVNMRHQ